MNRGGQIFALTDYSQIEKWWELVMSTFLLVSLHAKVLNDKDEANQVQDEIVAKFSQHDWWNKG